jgi:hypothetical protein
MATTTFSALPEVHQISLYVEILRSATQITVANVGGTALTSAQSFLAGAYGQAGALTPAIGEE